MLWTRGLIMNSLVFVTGATGFIGGALVRLLKEQGHRVRCLVRNEASQKHLMKYGVEFQEGNILDLEALKKGMEGASHVFHVAGVISTLTERDFYKINTEGFRTIAQACLYEKERSGLAPALVAVSSLAGAGPAKKKIDNRNLPLSEIDLPKPISPYGKSKYEGEKILQDFADQIPITIVRPPFVIGEGNRPSLSLFQMAANSWMFPGPGFINRPFSFIHVNDLVQMFYEAALHGERLTPDSLAPLAHDPLKCKGTGIYFTALPEIIRFFDFGKIIANAYGRKKITCFRIPPMVVVGAGITMECVKKIRRQPVSFDWNKMIESLSGPWICSVDKFTSQLNWKFEKSLKERIQQAAQGYLDQKMVILNEKVKRDFNQID